MKWIGLILFLFIDGFNLKAQSVNHPYVFCGTMTKHVLSEIIQSGTQPGVQITVNSLFIWERDRVIRIVFKLEKKLSLSSKTVGKLTPLNALIPPIDTYRLYRKTPRGSTRTVPQNLLDDVTESGQARDEIIGNSSAQNYKDKILIAINSWNRKHNPSAGVLGKIAISDSDPYVIFRNKKTQSQGNLLPLIFQVGGSDSFWLARPYVIDVYQAEDSNAIAGAAGPELRGFRLFTSISLIDNRPAKTSGAGWHLLSLGKYISSHTIDFICDSFLPGDNLAALEAMKKIDLAPRRSGTHTQAANHVPCSDLPGEGQAGDQFFSPVSPGRRTSGNCMADYQFCMNCHADSLSKIEKIRQHCPLVLLTKKPGVQEEIWSYVSSIRTHHLFKREMPVPQNDCGEPKVWQLLLPGIGYWMSNAALDNKGNYFVPDISSKYYTVNERPLIELKN